MAATKPLVFVLILISSFGEGSTAVDSDVDELFNVLLERIKSSDAANEARFAEMESMFRMKQIENEQEISSSKLQMKEMEANFKLREERMLKQINDLTTKLDHSCSDDDVNVNDETTQNEKIKDFNGDLISALESRKGRRSSIKQNREVPENEVAFYATHSEHDVHHIGANQILEFQQTVTNIGNAYNNNTGAFVAPVDGTYVIHATVMGIDIKTSGGHYSAHFDVNGAVYSKFWVTSYDQSSQMLIIALRSGDTVSIRNGHPDEGFVGQHYSTFSGFLLYQNYLTGVVVGK